MSHNVYSRRPNLWCNGSVPNARDFVIWDTYQYKALDGYNGGTWSPTSPIVIGGAGLVLSGSGSTLTGGLTTMQGGRIAHGHSDFVQLSPTRTRTEVMSLIGAVPFPGPEGVSFPTTGGGGTPVALSSVQGGTTGAAPFAVGPFDANVTGLRFAIPSRYLHQGATLESATLISRAISDYATFPTGVTQANLIAIGAPFTGIFPTVTPFLPTGATLLYPNAWPTWTSSTAYALDAYVIPGSVYASPMQTGLYYQATTGGTSSSSSPPIWPTTIGGTVTDGTVVWTAIGYAGTRPTGLTTPAAMSSKGAPIAMVMTPPSPSTFVIDCTESSYYLDVIFDSLAGPVLSYPTLSLTYGGIVDMRPE